MTVPSAILEIPVVASWYNDISPSNPQATIMIDGTPPDPDDEGGWPLGYDNNAFHYSWTATHKFCRGIEPTQDDINNVRNPSELKTAESLRDAMSKYETRTSGDDERYVLLAKMFDHLEIDESKPLVITPAKLGILIVAGVVDTARVLECLWPVYYGREFNYQQRVGKIKKYEPYDTSWMEMIEYNITDAEAMGPSAINEAARDIARVIDDFEKTWGEEVPFREAPKEIPIDGMPEPMKKYITHAEQSFNVGRDMVSAAALSVLCVSLMNTVRVRIKDDHHAAVLTSFLILAGPGEGKSHTFDHTLDPWFEFEKQLFKKSKHWEDELKTERTALEAAVASAASPKKTPAGPAGSPPTTVASAWKTMMDDRVRLEQLKSEIEFPMAYPSHSNDATPEFLVRKMCLSWTGFVPIMSDDTNLFHHASGGGRGIAADKYTMYLPAMTGGPVKNERKGDGLYGMSVRKAGMVAAVATQTKSFSEFVSENQAAFDRGFLDRFSMVYPVSKFTESTFDQDAVPAPIMRGWRDMVTRMCEESTRFIDKHVEEQKRANAGLSPRDREPWTQVPYRLIDIEPADKETIRRWKVARTDATKPISSPTHDMKGWISKSNDRSFMFAAMLTLADDPTATVIKSKYVQTALDISDALTDHAIFATHTRSESVLSELYDKIRQMREDLPDDRPLTVANVRAKVTGEIKTNLNKYLDQLEDRNKIKKIERKSGPRGGAPIRHIVVRPEGL